MGRGGRRGTESVEDGCPDGNELPQRQPLLPGPGGADMGWVKGKHQSSAEGPGLRGEGSEMMVVTLRQDD